MASEAAALIHDRDPGHVCPVDVESAEATSGRLGAVLRAPGEGGLTRLGEHGPWLATTSEQARLVLTDSARFDFPTTVTRDTDLSGSVADTRTGHHVYPPLTPAQVSRGLRTFLTQWPAHLAEPDEHARTQPGAGPTGTTRFDAMEALRRPVARATCAAVLGDLDDHDPDECGLDEHDRDALADQVLAWIDALGPVIASRRTPGRWSRARRAETRTRVELETTLARVLPACGISDAPHVVATFLAAGVQVPIAAGAWLLVLSAAHPDQGHEPDHVVWETLRVAPPTWVTARVTTGPTELAGHSLAAHEVVLVSPLLLGRSADLLPVDDLATAEFHPARWARDDVRPGAWLPFGAGAHACPGRNLGLALLRELAGWAGQHRLNLTDPVSIDQSRGIFPSPARVTAVRREASRR